MLVWKIASISVGSLLILLGLVMLVTPGPGWLAIFAGLAMLSPHSVLAKSILAWLKRKLGRLSRQARHAPAGASHGDLHESSGEERRARK